MMQGGVIELGHMVKRFGPIIQWSALTVICDDYLDEHVALINMENGKVTG
jgi:hypothetical protein